MKITKNELRKLIKESLEEISQNPQRGASREKSLQRGWAAAQKILVICQTALEDPGLEKNHRIWFQKIERMMNLLLDMAVD